MERFPQETESVFHAQERWSQGEERLRVSRARVGLNQEGQQALVNRVRLDPFLVEIAVSNAPSSITRWMKPARVSAVDLACKWTQMMPTTDVFHVKQGSILMMTDHVTSAHWERILLVKEQPSVLHANVGLNRARPEMSVRHVSKDNSLREEAHARIVQ